MDDDSGVPHAEVASLPTDFGSSVVLLDVRENDEWQRGHAEHATHIPMGEVADRLAEIDPDAQLFLICHLGGRSLRVAHYLQSQGYRPVNVAGGMQAWTAAGRPVITDDGLPGTV